MKVEICEQMLQTWLLNCQLCEIVQTNWTISPLRLRTIDQYDIANVQIVMEDIQKKLNDNGLDDEIKNALQENMDADFQEEYLLDSDEVQQQQKRKRKSKKLNIFKKSNASQFIRQCEIDVVGVKFDNGVAEKIFLVDTAFHKAGLGYHDAVATVLKKIIRALAVAVIIFGEDVPVNVVFASPKCNIRLKKEIEDVVQDLLAILGQKYSNITIELYFNEDFSTQIYEPLKKEIDNLNNDNDLYMRALNLTKVAEEHLPRTSTFVPQVAPKVSIKNNGSSGKARKGRNESIVFDILKSIIKDGKMSCDLLDDLQTPNYARTNFKLPRYPFLLKESSFRYSGFERCRFYKHEIVINGDKYFVCSQWIPERITLLKEWFNKL